MSVKRKIPINWSLFGDFSRGRRLNVAFLYFWLRSQSTYDHDVEYLQYVDDKPFANKFLHDCLGYGINQIPKMLDILEDSGLIEMDHENKRYVFRADFKDGDWVYISLEVLQFLVNRIIEKEFDKVDALPILLLCVLALQDSKHRYLEKQYGQVKPYIFSYRDLMDTLGYSKTTNADIVRRALNQLEDYGFVSFIRSNGNNCSYHYMQYKQLVSVNV